MSSLVACISSSLTVVLFLIFLFFPATLTWSMSSDDSTISSDCCCGIIDSSASVFSLLRHFLASMISNTAPAKIIKIHNSKY